MVRMERTRRLGVICFITVSTCWIRIFITNSWNYLLLRLQLCVDLNGYTGIQIRNSIYNKVVCLFIYYCDFLA